MLAFLKQNTPCVVIHTAAMTDVRAAEVEKLKCWNTNVHGVERLVAALQEVAPDCHFVYASTACVFQGDQGNYSEDDLPNPKNFYGLSKLIGEYVAQRMRSCLVIRTNFVARAPWAYLRAFTDRFGTYLYAEDVAQAICRLVEERETGLVHVTGTRRMSMYELACLTSPDVGTMTMAEISIPLTIDMSLRSNRLEPVEIGSAERIPSS
jgi:dTDP-4-dehydrorhamnose reductase